MDTQKKTTQWLQDATNEDLKDQLYALGFRESENGKDDQGNIIPPFTLDELSPDAVFDKLVEYYALNPEESPA